MLFGIAWYWWVAIILFVLWIIKTAWKLLYEIRYVRF